MAKKKIEELKVLVSNFPVDPGVYLMKNHEGDIIYVGKAKNLKNRVRSYLNSSKEHSSKTKLLVKNIDHIDTIITDSEAEAFLLEASLIKKHRPKFNVRLKDDKAYPYIKISLKDEFPRLYLSRRVNNDGAEYYGPYTSAFAVRQTIKFLNKNFKIRDCKDSYMKSRTRPCMTYQIGRCTAPCVDYINKENYAKDIYSALEFLRGKDQELFQNLENRMWEASENEDFEHAAHLRDSIQALQQIIEKQSVINAGSSLDQDVLAIFGNHQGSIVESLHIRQGKLIGNQFHYFDMLDLKDPDEDIRDVICSYVIQFYQSNIVPDELIVPIELGSDLTKLMVNLLEEKKASKVKVIYPKTEQERKLLELANKNAEEHFNHQMQKISQKHKGLSEIQRKLKLVRTPERIECFDISHFQGKEVVASQTVFVDGSPAKEFYRRYKIKTVEGNNDFASMKEVISRRMSHSEWEYPDLIVIDGGKGQLKMALEVMSELGIQDIAIVGLAKARVKSQFEGKIIEESEERFYLPNRENPVVFSPHSSAFQILTGIRDEAHRFAITYHRNLREKKSLESELDFIVGLGEKRKRSLLKKYDSIDEIRSLTVDEISEMKGFNRVLAERILLQLNEKDQEEDA